MIVCGCLFKDVKSFSGIEIGAFTLGVQNLHAFLYFAKCVLLVATCSAYFEVWWLYWKALVFIISGSEDATYLSDVCLSAAWARESVDS